MTVNGNEIPADDCSEPALPTIEKVGVGAAQDPDDPSRWLVTYNVTVTSGGYDTFYSLSDTPGFPVGVDLVEGRAQRTDIADEPVLTITTGADFVTGVGLLAGETHVYQVAWLVDIQDTADPDDADCTGEPGNGFFNTATLTVGAIPIDDEDCIPVVDRVYPTVTKTATSTNQDPATGDWTITYDLVVTLAEAARPPTRWAWMLSTTSPTRSTSAATSPSAVPSGRVSRAARSRRRTRQRPWRRIM